jgi:glycosyltransferase involved in cell wall biosynthesis
MALLSLISYLRKTKPEWFLGVLLLDGGDLESEFAEKAHKIHTPYKRKKKSVFLKGIDFLKAQIFRTKLERQYLSKYYSDLLALPYDVCFYNTIESLRILTLPYIPRDKMPSKSLLYLLESVYYYQKSDPLLVDLISQMDFVIATSNRVRKQLKESPVKIKSEVSVIYCSSIYKDYQIDSKINDNVQMQIYGSGVVHHRKGFDWFFQLALEVKRRYPELPVTWTWIGAVDSLVYSLTLTDAILLGIDFQFTGEIRNPLEEYFKRDLMILTSREEPSSLAGFESSILGKPVMYFKDRTGFEEVDENAAELAFEYGDLAAMSDKIKELAENRDKLKTLGERNRIKFRNYMLENMAESFIQIIENA